MTEQEKVRIECLSAIITQTNRHNRAKSNAIPVKGSAKLVVTVSVTLYALAFVLVAFLSATPEANADALITETASIIEIR